MIYRYAVNSVKYRKVVIIRRGELQKITEPLFAYLESVYSANIEEIDKYTPASTNPEIRKEVESMPGMSQVIFKNGIAQGISQGITQGREQGQNELVDAVNRLRAGESPESIVSSGIDKHTVDLAMTIR